MNMIELDGDEDWLAFIDVCARLARRPVSVDEMDRLYAHWLKDVSCADAVRDVLGKSGLAPRLFVVGSDGVMHFDDFVEQPADGLVHISTPLREVDRQIRAAVDNRHIERVMAEHHHVAVAGGVQCGEADVIPAPAPRSGRNNVGLPGIFALGLVIGMLIGMAVATAVALASAAQ